MLLHLKKKKKPFLHIAETTKIAGWNSSGHFLKFDSYQKPAMMIVLELVACLHALHIVKTTTILKQLHGTFLNMPNSLHCAFVFFSLGVQTARYM